MVQNEIKQIGKMYRISNGMNFVEKNEAGEGEK